VEEIDSEMKTSIALRMIILVMKGMLMVIMKEMVVIHIEKMTKKVKMMTDTGMMTTTVNIHKLIMMTMSIALVVRNVYKTVSTRMSSAPLFPIIVYTRYSA